MIVQNIAVHVLELIYCILVKFQYLVFSSSVAKRGRDYYLLLLLRLLLTPLFNCNSNLIFESQNPCRYVSSIHVYTCIYIIHTSKPTSSCCIAYQVCVLSKFNCELANKGIRPQINDGKVHSCRLVAICEKTVRDRENFNHKVMENLTDQ